MKLSRRTCINELCVALSESGYFSNCTVFQEHPVCKIKCEHLNSGKACALLITYGRYPARSNAHTRHKVVQQERNITSNKPKPNTFKKQNKNAPATKAKSLSQCQQQQNQKKSSVIDSKPPDAPHLSTAAIITVKTPANR